MRSALLNVMVQAATKAGRSLAKDFGEVENLQVSVKAQPISFPMPTSGPKRSSSTSCRRPARPTPSSARKALR